MSGTRTRTNKSKGTLIKYMGSSDVHFLAPGENFGGRLADALEKRVQWDWSNHHVVDVTEAGMSAEATDLLLEDPNFVDVTGLKVYPVGMHERLWRSIKADTVDPNAEEAGEEVPLASEDATGDTPAE